MSPPLCPRGGASCLAYGTGGGGGVGGRTKGCAVKMGRSSVALYSKVHLSPEETLPLQSGRFLIRKKKSGRSVAGSVFRLTIRQRLLSNRQWSRGNRRRLEDDRWRLEGN